jgi:hypothetical protein
MTCADVLSELDDYVDGLLSEASFQEVELHLDTCSACREEERLLRGLLAHAAAMPRLLDPPRDLWPGIAERLSEPGLAMASGRGIAFWAAAAAAILALASWIHVRPGTPGTSPEPRGQGRLVQASLSTNPPLLEAEVGYLKATEELAAALESRRASLPPETLQVVDQNLRIINEALRSVREALEKDPGNHELTHMLLSTHRKKVEILRRASFLT